MNIGIDVDGVIQNTEVYFRAAAEIYDLEHGGFGVKDHDAVKVEKRMNWPAGMFEQFVYDKMFDIMKTAPLMPYAKEVIDWLKSKGHKLFLITARGTFSNVEVDIAKQMVDEYELKFDKVFYNAQDKLVPCVEEKIDYMIDDAVSNVTRLSENGVKCLYFRRNDGKEINHENVTEVLNWGEIYRFFYDK